MLAPFYPHYWLAVYAFVVSWFLSFFVTFVLLLYPDLHFQVVTPVASQTADR